MLALDWLFCLLLFVFLHNNVFFLSPFTSNQQTHHKQESGGLMRADEMRGDGICERGLDYDNKPAYDETIVGDFEVYNGSSEGKGGKRV
ncbi:hypothetical protein QBC38DRAFT_473552 [Podospora fimiseda]|uniref:Uncharacterized protein n=1 Tax=Podospora fimiseda TaxID=252190 RepID=A0AAN7BSV1_9PEZI|nr:hypothetical protein QBC38DRAFT_473552 [Podospora fimiseda]